jgi:hypothetical protein
MRGSQPIGGQYWRQEDRHMASTNLVYLDADSSRESVVLSAIYDAVAWKHALELHTDPNVLRTQQQIVVYPKNLKIEAVLKSNDLNRDLNGNRMVLYQKSAKECQLFTHPPIFL